MKLFAIVFLVGTLTVLSSCNDQTLEDLGVAQGKVAGIDWEFKGGSAISGIDEIAIILTNIESNSPCSILNPNRPYVKFTIPARAGTYHQVDFSSIDKEVKFFEGSSSTKNLTFSSGFVQIISINGFSVDGLIQASFDDDNDIAGAFFATSCN